MIKGHHSSLLSAGIPINRGIPEHVEHTDDMAFTEFDKSGRVVSIHTPRQILIRVHELMHARATDKRRYNRQYKGIRDTVVQITEDARIHIRAWPWRYNTPKVVENAARAYVNEELQRCDAIVAEKPLARGMWADFATRFRAAAVLAGLDGGSYYDALDKVKFADKAQRNLAQSAIHTLRSGKKPKEGQVAAMLEAAFFPPLPEIDINMGAREACEKIGRASNRAGKITLEVIELEHSEHIADAKVGTRLARSGSRIHRPLLRRPVIPQRLFVRRTPIEAGGTILVDASGSMGDWDQVRQWCEKAPFGTIAYYAGANKNGWLFVYARNGRRASDIRPPPSGGNTVDGPAIDWLMQQPAPRIMVTDREFCGAPDSVAQVARLANLERAGEITVVDYSTNKEEDD